jgi:hypothetical protein
MTEVEKPKRYFYMDSDPKSPIELSRKRKSKSTNPSVSGETRQF